MDPLGLALGVSGLIPLYKVCLQLFDLVEAGRTQGTDLEILSTMLEIERVRLCIWGQTVGLVSADGNSLDAHFSTELDGRLEDRRISSAVSDVLACMKRIFEDSDALKQKYGLQKVGDVANSMVIRGESGRIALRTTFKRTLERFNSSISNQHNTNLISSTKWIIVDKRRFEILVDDLRDFNDSLSSLLPDIDSFTRQEIATVISESVDADGLRLIEQAAERGLHDDFSEAASVRLSQISEITNPDNDHESISTASTISRPVDVENLMKQIDKLEVQLKAQNRGMLKASMYDSYGKYWGFVTWDDVRSDEWFITSEKELEFVQPMYLALGKLAVVM
jgi:Prion-inhibition and propagation